MKWEDAFALLMEAHNRACLDNNNVSSAMVRQMAAVGESFEKSVAAALLSLGGKVHGPTADARHILFQATDDEIKERLDRGERIPGFGNAFYSDKIDPAFCKFFTVLESQHEEIWKRLEAIADLIEDKTGRWLYPNAASATAITAEFMNLPIGTEIQLVIRGRLAAWAQQWSEL